MTPAERLLFIEMAYAIGELYSRLGGDAAKAGINRALEKMKEEKQPLPEKEG